jgi:hypothetical protein
LNIPVARFNQTPHAFSSKDGPTGFDFLKPNFNILKFRARLSLHKPRPGHSVEANQIRELNKSLPCSIILAVRLQVKPVKAGRCNVTKSG